MLYIVATPIGNLRDISFRAVEVLGSVDLIACEDTRHTKILLANYSISKPTTSFFQHNRFTKGEYILRLLKEGKNIALVSDAGTPGVLYPGYNLVNLASKNNIEITVIPGPCALINALVLSGKPAHEFYFAGFLPHKTISRKNKLKELAVLKCTILCYESCHRITASLKDIQAIFGAREIVVARELTKKFEEIIRAKPSIIIENFQETKPRGEFVIII
jgi:16S rRNA (cytidine1402-2'-O)-methyltransferase